MQITVVLRPAPPQLRPSQHAAVAAFGARFGLRASSRSPSAEDVRLEGSPGDLARAFGVTLVDREHPLGSFRTHEHPLRVPAELLAIVAGFIGFDETPASISRLHHTRVSRVDLTAAATPQSPPIPVARLVEHYNFPRALDGSGQRIAIISLGGGFHQSDIDEYCAAARIRAPKLRVISVDGATNAPLAMPKLRRVVTEYNKPAVSLGQLWRDFPHDLAAGISTVEATMDVQIAIAAAPGAAIEVYFAPNSPQGLYQAIVAALGTDDAPPPAAISISWGWPEENLSGDAASLINQSLERASNAGACVCCASGDSGSVGLADDDISADAASVLFPASSPWVLACGGTQLRDARIDHSGETAWNSLRRGVQQATGGGVSGAFPVPAWQRLASVPAHGTLNGAAWVAPSVPPTARQEFVGRGVPDVAAYAAQEPGYELRIGGQVCGAGGTSAATPLWAGLVARFAQRVGVNVRSLPQLVYTPALASAFRSIPVGNNAIHGATSAASFAAHAGWNACCGVGTPDGERILAALERVFPPNS